MKKLLLAIAAVLLALATPVMADTLDPLHGTICSAGGVACNATEVGGVVPGAIFGAWATSPTFGFNSSPAGATGEVWISILIPTNQWTGTFPVLSSLGVDPGAQIPKAGFGGQVWGPGSPDLAVAMFGNSITSNPANPFSAFQQPESLQDPGLTGFFVLAADIGPITLPG